MAERPKISAEETLKIAQRFSEKCFHSPRAAEIAPKLKKEGLVVRFKYFSRNWEEQPQITVDCRKEPIAVMPGASRIKPTAEIRMEAETTHKLFMGRLNVPLALLRRQIVIKGSRLALVKILPMINVERARKYYRETLKELKFNKLLNY